MIANGRFLCFSLVHETRVPVGRMRLPETVFTEWRQRMPRNFCTLLGRRKMQGFSSCARLAACSRLMRAASIDELGIANGDGIRRDGRGTDRSTTSLFLWMNSLRRQLATCNYVSPSDLFSLEQNSFLGPMRSQPLACERRCADLRLDLG